MSRLPTLLRTAWALGLPSIARVLAYRGLLRAGLHPVQRLAGEVPEGPLFRPPSSDLPPVAAQPVSAWQTEGLLFGHWRLAIRQTPPDWHCDPLGGGRVSVDGRPWWRIPDFDPEVGDIKRIWELSRMDWALAWAQRARQGDWIALARLNDWLTDWCLHNPPYQGPNWKCGQEASFRVMHLAASALMLGQVRNPQPALSALVCLHLQRIAATLSYAVGQDNNHGTSEAAALFIGGSWMQALGVAEGARWTQIGRHWLENRISRLVATDGSFSQQSVNYHRVLLDTCSMAEAWRRHLNLAPFSPRWQSRMKTAALWMYRLVNLDTGDAPNLGANDGARLLPLSDAPFRDHRPTLQLALALFAGQRACRTPGPWDAPLLWLSLPLPAEPALDQDSCIADEGGYGILRQGSTLAVLRYPCYRFRPGQADPLHLDLWVNGCNLLRDTGSYSYNTESRWLEYFGGIAGHNTIQFDGREPMPRLGRFLFGDWLSAEGVEPLADREGALCFGAGYRDRKGARHHRRVALGDHWLRVEDEIDGFSDRAVLRWRLSPGDWRRVGDGVSDGTWTLDLNTTMSVLRCELVEGWESRHYLEKTPLPVLEIEVTRPGRLVTTIRWAS